MIASDPNDLVVLCLGLVDRQVGNGDRLAGLVCLQARAISAIRLEPFELERVFVRRSDMCRAGVGRDQGHSGAGYRKDVDDPADQVIQDPLDRKVGRQRSSELTQHCCHWIMIVCHRTHLRTESPAGFRRHNKLRNPR